MVKTEKPFDTECLVAILGLGLCVALENKTMTLDNARLLLFSPATLHLLEQNKASSELISLIDLGMELEFVERIIPQDLPDRLSEIKSIALSVLQSSPESWEPEEGWLAQSKKVKVTRANGYIVLVGINDTVAVKAELESRDVVGACEASGNTIKVMQATANTYDGDGNPITYGGYNALAGYGSVAAS